MSTRINQHGQPYEVDDRGSAYITHLHTQLAIAKTLAEQITNLNPNCLSLGEGYMANMRLLARQLQACNS